MLADCGFGSREGVEQLQARGIAPLVAVGRTQPHRPSDFRPPPAVTRERPIEEPWRLDRKAELETPDGQALYKRRKQTVEPVFGIKCAMGVLRFHLRGFGLVAGEWTIVALADNCRRVHRLRQT